MGNDFIPDDTNDLTGNEMENQHEDATSTDSNSENDTDIENGSMNNVFPVCDETSQRIQLEKCMQPADLSIDASRIMSIDPGEGKFFKMITSKNFPFQPCFLQENLDIIAKNKFI